MGVTNARLGGVLLYTAPQLAQYHMVPGDFYRYTKEGSLKLLVSNKY